MRHVLVLPCGGKKIATRTPVLARDLYAGPLWSTYRRYAVFGRGGRNEIFDTFVLSAEHGLIPEDERLLPYDRVMVPDTWSRPLKDGTPVRRVSELVGEVSRQARRHRLLQREVVFIGEVDGPYEAVLRGAGVEPVELELGGHGIGYYRGALRELLEHAATAYRARTTR